MSVSGVLDFATVIPLLDEGDRWLREAAPASCYVDLDGVNDVNSAATALLLGWLRSARKAGKQLTIHNIPDKLNSLMELMDLGTLLDDLSVLGE